MFAVIDVLGQQFKVSENSKIYVPRLKEDINKEVTFDKILLFSDDNGVKVGSPLLSDLSVKAKVLEHVKDDKVLVFKKKRRKGYQKLNGHRQQLSRIEITKIG